MRLFDNITIGDLVFKNRMAMAPMTRSRANLQGVVSDLTVEYYQQRATAGLIISEAINISEQAIGSPFTPGLYTAEQIAAWKKVTAAVHEAGGAIYAQLWHTGRVSHSIDKQGQQPVSASAVAIQGQQHFTSQGQKDYETPRALSTEEVKEIVKTYHQAAKNAIEAGFDGVELHGAFGYLPNQFLVDGVNHRTDEYGGSIENRTRFVLEVMAGLVDAVGKDRAAIKLSPSIPYNGMIDSNPTALFGYLIQQLNEMPLAYLHLMNALFPLDGLPHYPKDVLETFGSFFDKTIMANGGYTRDTAEAELASSKCQMVSFGNLYLSNPDLRKRFELDAPLNTADRATMYGGGEKGYTDYPFMG
jgi:N-ethylmaleimide reductase